MKAGREVVRCGLVLALIMAACAPSEPASEPEEAAAPEPEIDFVQEAVWAPRGDRLLATWNQGDRFRLYGVMAPDTTGAAVEASTGLRVSDGPDMSAAWAPDRVWVAFGSTRDGNGEIYRMRPDGMQEENLTNHEADDREPTYSPDGRQIAFISDRTDGVPRLHIMDADGSNVRMVGSPQGLSHHAPEWSPDGTRIALHVTMDEAAFVYVATPEGGWGRVKRGELPSWSPNSEVIYFGREGGLFAVRVQTNGLRDLEITGSAPHVSPDGRWLAYIRGEWPVSALYATDLATGEEYRLTR